jgi:hypothetical protein
LFTANKPAPLEVMCSKRTWCCTKIISKSELIFCKKRQCFPS